MSTSSSERNTFEILAEEFLERKRRGGAGPALPIGRGWLANHGDCAPIGA